VIADSVAPPLPPGENFTRKTCHVNPRIAIAKMWAAGLRASMEVRLPITGGAAVM
jgi:hypothetical protein